MDNDLTIRDDVQAELEFEPLVDAAGIGVAVVDGVVTLSGHVASYAQKIAAEVAAKRVKGVRALAEELEVRLPFASQHDDEEIARRAANVLEWTITAPREGVKLKVENGWVTLSGEVVQAFERTEAERALRRLEGVRGVSNLIKLKPGVAATDIRDRLKKAFHRNAELEASRIAIAVEGGRVTLSGKVDKWSDRSVAENAAWAVPGVYQVEDRLTL